MLTVHMITVKTVEALVAGRIGVNLRE